MSSCAEIAYATMVSLAVLLVRCNPVITSGASWLADLGVSISDSRKLKSMPNEAVDKERPNC